MGSAGGGLAGRAPRFSRGGSLARLTGTLRGSAGPKSPGRGWLRGASSRGHSPGRSSLGRSSLGRGAFGQRRMGRGFGVSGLGQRGHTTAEGVTHWAGPAAHATSEGEAEMADRRLPMNVASRRRLLVLYVIAAAMLISLGGRLWYLQVMNNTAFTKLAAANQTRDVIVPAVRGQILDDVGTGSATNQTALVVSVDMMNLFEQPGGAAPVLHRLAPLLGMSDKLLTTETRLCTVGVQQPCWAGAAPAHPGGPERFRSGRAAGDGGAEAVPRGDRAGPAGDRVPAAGRRQPSSGTRLPAAHHPAGDRQPAPAGDRLLRRGPGRPGLPGGPVRRPAPRPGRDPGGAQSTPQATSPAPSARPRRSTATTW